ncbi:MAG: DHHW family protein, partial [Lacrimispora sphenoides]
EITNPNVKNGKELVIFRDSFGSSLAPLLLDGYSKVTMVDIRYIASDLVGDYITFDDQDVLFVYSTSVLNSSAMFK